MTAVTHDTVRTESVDIGGTAFAYRRFGRTQGVPLVFLQHFRGVMDDWDPAVTDALAGSRPVVLFDNRGVGATGGEAPATVGEMARDAALFLDALGLEQVDVLGFSLGGFLAQALAGLRPGLVRKLVLVGTGPSGPSEPVTGRDILQIATQHETPTEDDFLTLFFGESPASRSAGRRFWQRKQARTDRVPTTTPRTSGAQVAAMINWHQTVAPEYLAFEQQRIPTLIVNGTRDVMVPTERSFDLARRIPDAQLIIYPDAAHGAHYQYPETFSIDVATFLERTTLR
jgi:pimeloyl-ACP methyl ester carboxylesterase